MEIPEPPKDKRTKAYKEWKAKYDAAPQGLGDTVEKITKATGIKKVVDKVFDALGKDCGCDSRKEKLNKVFRYEKPLCLEESEFNYLAEFFGRKSNSISSDQQNQLLAIYNRIFSQDVKPTGCSPCFVNGVYKKLQTVYNEYL